MEKCVYCGDDADTKDHIVPVSYYYDGIRSGRHLTNEYGKENLVDACKECNSIAGNKVFPNINDKKDYIQERIKMKYKKVINSVYWSDEEISEMGINLQKEIRIQQLARKWILNRINYPVNIYPYVKFNQELQRFMEKEF
jgi:hypothetical protein